MDVGTVSSEDVMTSYENQLTEAHRKIALLEAALVRERRATAQARMEATAAREDRTAGQGDPEEV